jgi:hypothetical protein
MTDKVKLIIHNHYGVNLEQIISNVSALIPRKRLAKMEFDVSSLSFQRMAIGNGKWQIVTLSSLFLWNNP